MRARLTRKINLNLKKLEKKIFFKVNRFFLLQGHMKASLTRMCDKGMENVHIATAMSLMGRCVHVCVCV